MPESENGDWRQLCVAAAREPDAAKLTRLVNQLIRAIDETIARPNASHAPVGDGTFWPNR